VLNKKVCLFLLFAVGLVIAGTGITQQASNWVYISNKDLYRKADFTITSARKRRFNRGLVRVFLEGEIAGTQVSREANAIGVPHETQQRLMNFEIDEIREEVLFAPELRGKYLFNGDIAILSIDFENVTLYSAVVTSIFYNGVLLVTILYCGASLGSDLVFGFQPNCKPPRGRA